MGKHSNKHLKDKLSRTRKKRGQHDDALRKTWTQLWKNNIQSITEIPEREPTKFEKSMEWLTNQSQMINYITVLVSIVQSLIYYITFIILFSNERLYLQSWITGQILSTRTWTLYVPILFYFVSAVQIYHVRNDYLVANEADMLGLGGLFILITASFSLNDCILLAKHISVNKYAYADGLNEDLTKKLCLGFLEGLHIGANHDVIHPPARLLAKEFSERCGDHPIDNNSSFWKWVKEFKPPKFDPVTHQADFDMPENFTCCRWDDCMCYNEDPNKLNQQEFKMCLAPWWKIIRNVCIGSYLTGIFYAISLYFTLFAYMLHYHKMKEKAKSMFGKKELPYFIKRTDSLARREQIKKLLLPRLRKRHAENKKKKVPQKYKYTLVRGDQSTTYTIDTRNYKGVRSWKKSRALKQAIARARACRTKDQSAMPNFGPFVTELHFKTKAEAKQSEMRLKKRVLANKRKRYEEIEGSKFNIKPLLSRNQGERTRAPDENEKLKTAKLNEVSKPVKDKPIEQAKEVPPIKTNEVPPIKANEVSPIKAKEVPPIKAVTQTAPNAASEDKDKTKK